MTSLAAKLMPYFSYFLYAQLLLLCLAVLVGCVLVIKRLLGRPTFAGDPSYDYEKIAREMDTEIERLEELRNRILPGERHSHGPGVGGGLSVAAVEQKYQDQMEAMRIEFERKIEQLSLSGVGAGAANASAGSGDSPSPEQVQAQVNEAVQAKTQELEQQKLRELESLKKELDQLKKSEQQTTERAKHLESVVADYQIFEEDLAFIKKYKSENEAMARRLAEATGGSVSSSAPAPAPTDVVNSESAAPLAPATAAAMVTEQEIANIFNELEQKTPDAVAKEVPIAAEPVVVSAPEPVLPSSEPSLTAASVKTMTQEEKEALAESALDNDSLMAEFEKLLGGENKS